MDLPEIFKNYLKKIFAADIFYLVDNFIQVSYNHFPVYYTDTALFSGGGATS